MTSTTIDPVTALIVVDLQNGVLRFPYAHPLKDVVANAGELAAAFRARGLPVVLTTVTGPARGGRTDVTLPLPGELPPDWDQPLADLDPRPTDHRVPKRRWGSFVGTDMEAHLKGAGVTQVVVLGVATCFGVESTARQAAELGFNVTLATDAMTDWAAEAHEHSVTRVFPLLGECRTTRQVLDGLDAMDSVASATNAAL